MILWYEFPLKNPKKNEVNKQGPIRRYCQLR